MSKTTFNRRLQLWQYDVSHRQLLLRAVDSGEPTRIDLLFKDVQAMSLPVTMKVLNVRQVALRRFEVEYEGGIAVIEAGAACWLEDNESFDQPSQLTNGRIAHDFEQGKPAAPAHPIAMVN